MPSVKKRSKSRDVALAAGLLGAALMIGGAPDGRAAGRDGRARAERLMRAGRDREALLLLDEAVRADPGDGRAYEDRGVARWRMLTASDDDAGAGFVWIQNQRCLGDRDDCPDLARISADLDTAVHLLTGPARGQALFERAQVLARENERTRALADEDAAILLQPDAPAFREARAGLRRQAGDVVGALADLDAALRLRPDDGADLSRRAELRQRTGDLAGARADLDIALRHPPSGDTPDWLDKARALRRAVALPDEPGMGREIGDLEVRQIRSLQEPDGLRRLRVTFDQASAKRLSAYTTAHVGSEVQVIFDGAVVLQPRIVSPITDGVLEITANTTKAARLAQRLGDPGAIVVMRAAD